MDVQTYKHVVNYLRNELGINKEFIRECVDKTIKNEVKQALQQQSTDYKIGKTINEAVASLVADGSHNWNTASTKEAFSKAVLAEVRKAVGVIMSKDFEISFDVKKKGGE
jgi:adenine-specific DNA methylase